MKLNSIRHHDIHLASVKFGIWDTENKISICFNLPSKTIYNQLGYEFMLAGKKRLLTETAYLNNMSVLFLIAIKDRKIYGDEALKIEAELAFIQPLAHLYWVCLELFRSVARLSSRINLNTPDLIKNEEKAWGDFFSRAVFNPKQYKSKREIVNNLRALAREIRQNNNPFRSEDVEIRLFIDWAFFLTNPTHSKKSEPNDVRTLRKHIRQKLKDLHQALTGFATFLDRSPCKLLKQIGGKTYKVGIKNHLSLVN